MTLKEYFNFLMLKYVVSNKSQVYGGNEIMRIKLHDHRLYIVHNNFILKYAVLSKGTGDDVQPIKSVNVSESMSLEDAFNKVLKWVEDIKKQYDYD